MQLSLSNGGQSSSNEPSCSRKVDVSENVKVKQQQLIAKVTERIMVTQRQIKVKENVTVEHKLDIVKVTGSVKVNVTRSQNVSK